ncbi:MAG: cation:proton antiporter [Streptococcaceae bacterium]|nr:cation:proton antiporter [Streptococcaceae bacterium]
MTEYGMIAAILIISTLIGAFFTRLNLPAVVGQLLVGIILGPAMFNAVHLTKPLHFIAEIGVVFLMFIAGLESDLSMLKKFMKPAVAVAALGVIFPLISFLSISQLLGYSQKQALLFGLVYAATSVSITVSVLQEYKKLNTVEGATILGAAVVDDIIAVLLLGTFVTMYGKRETSLEQLPFYLTLILQIAYMLFLFIVIRFGAAFVMKFFYELSLFASETIGAVIICLTLAELAKLSGMSDVIGAFFAGIVVAQSKKKIREKIKSSLSMIGYTFFIPIFFASIGMQMTFATTGVSFKQILIALVTAVLSKLFGCSLAAKVNGFSWKSSYIVGSGMVSRGEMGLIIAQIGFTNAIVNKNVYSELVIVIILCTLLAPFLLKHSFKKEVILKSL